MKNSTGILMTLLGAACGVVAGRLNSPKERKPGNDKLRNYFHLMDYWLTLKEKGKNTSGYFMDNDFHTISIYGLGVMGRHLYEDLKGTEINIICAIDKNPQQAYADLDLKTPEEELPSADAVVVTATFDFEAIEEALQKKMDCPIVSLEEVILASM